MAQQIAQFPFTVWQGVLLDAEQEVNLFTQPAVDGFGVQWGAYRAPPRDIVTKLTVATVEAADALILQYQQLLKAKLPIVAIDQFGKAWPETLILRVGAGADLGLWKAYSPFGVCVVTRWNLLVKSVRP